jgi:hypothetical protein
MSMEHLYETETMAELCARQGRLSEAIAIFRELAETAADSATRARARARLDTLEASWQPLRVAEVPPCGLGLARHSRGCAVAGRGPGDRGLGSAA